MILILCIIMVLFFFFLSKVVETCPHLGRSPTCSNAEEHFTGHAHSHGNLITCWIKLNRYNHPEVVQSYPLVLNALTLLHKLEQLAPTCTKSCGEPYLAKQSMENQHQYQLETIGNRKKRLCVRLRLGDKQLNTT